MRAISTYRRVLLTALALSMTVSAVGAKEVAEDVAAAFRNSNAGAVRGFLLPEGRIYVALPVLEVEEGFVGSDQLFYLLDQLFERATTIAFDITTTDSSDGDTMFVRANWTLRYDKNRERRVRVSIALSRSGKVWVIRELRGNRG